MSDRSETTPWVPIGYREEERTYFPLLTWSGKHMWWAIRLIGRLNPEWSSRLAIFALSYWPRFRYHILVVGKLSKAAEIERGYIEAMQRDPELD